MKVVTVLTNFSNKGFEDYLLPSSEHYHLDLTILEIDLEYKSHRLKDLALYEFVKGLPSGETVLFTDAYDTVFVSDEKEIVRKFEEFQSPLVFSAEINCWPDQEVRGKYPLSQHHFKYLNCGGFIGEAGYIKAAYEKHGIFSTACEPDYLWSNQHYWHHVYLANSEEIKIDHACNVFYNTSLVAEKLAGVSLGAANPKTEELIRSERQRIESEIDFHGHRIEYKASGSSPCHIHFPGPISKRLMESSCFEQIKAWL